MNIQSIRHLSLPRHVQGWFLVGILVLLFGTYWLISRSAPLPAVASHPVVPAVAVESPPLTPSTVAKLKQSNGFQALITYTPSGFEPTRLVIEAGYTVRFTNNSHAEIRVKERSTARARPDCAHFDSCESIAPGDFWEFTFEDPGTWEYNNANAPAMMGTVEVR